MLSICLLRRQRHFHNIFYFLDTFSTLKMDPTVPERKLLKIYFTSQSQQQLTSGYRWKIDEVAHVLSCDLKWCWLLWIFAQYYFEWLCLCYRWNLAGNDKLFELSDLEYWTHRVFYLRFSNGPLQYKWGSGCILMWGWRFGIVKWVCLWTCNSSL